MEISAGADLEFLSVWISIRSGAIAGSSKFEGVEGWFGKLTSGETADLFAANAEPTRA